jgi:hypothetical protein
LPSPDSARTKPTGSAAPVSGPAAAAGGGFSCLSAANDASGTKRYLRGGRGARKKGGVAAEAGKDLERGQPARTRARTPPPPPPPPPPPCAKNRNALGFEERVGGRGAEHGHGRVHGKEHGDEWLLRALERGFARPAHRRGRSGVRHRCRCHFPRRLA